MSGVLQETSAALRLVPYIPRLALEWLRDHPERRHTQIDGTLVFVDISGFTNLTEQLSKKGKVGGEEMNDILNACFAEFLNNAYDFGAAVIKWGGDAVLLLFQGEEHEARAARAAWEMQQTMHRVGLIETGAEPVTLKMSIGVASGAVDFFLVGDLHRELVVAGPVATRTVAMESIADAGEVALSEETAAALPRSVLGDRKEEAILVSGAADVVGGRPEAVGEMEGVKIAHCLPVDIREHLAGGGGEPEHRAMTAAFIHFMGVDELLEREGPPAVADALEKTISEVERIAHDHEVAFFDTDIYSSGGKIMLMAGAPRSTGFDEERMLRTMRAVMDAELPLALRIGINRGWIFVGDFGPVWRHTYTVTGDAVNLAARLMSKAEPGQILVTDDVLTRSATAFDTTALEPFTAKGKSEPVHAFALGPIVVEEGPKAEAHDLPFVDRERERAVLSASVAPVQMGFGTLVELVGDPGIGKSRLAQELQEHCAEMVMVHARCDQYQAATAYYPFRPVLRSLLDVELNGGGAHNQEVLAQRLAAVDEELVPWTPLLAAPLDVEVESTPEVEALDPSFWRARLHGVVGKLLGDLLPSPTLLLFEDVHWMDDASSELLRHLGTQLSTRPWLTCTTRRPGSDGFAAAEGTPPLPALTLRLEPLPEEDAKTLIRAAAGERGLSDDELAAIFERGAGNPLFLQELSSAEEAVEAGEELPETVGALVATRIDRLAPGDRSLLRWASVLGASFSASVIADVLEGDETVAAGSEAWDRLNEFVERDPDVPGGFRFRHVLIRDAAYEGLPFKRRRELHGRVAEVIERRQGNRPEDAAELLSLHFYRAERWPETWRYSVTAARRAEEKYANVEAAQFFERGLEVLDRVPEVPAEAIARVWEALADTRMRMAEYERAADAYRASRAAFPGDVVEQARLMQKEAIAPFRLGRYEQALERLDEALRLLEDVGGQAASAQRARLFSWYASVLVRQRRQDAVIEWCKRAVAEAEASGAEDALAQAYFVLDIAYAALGRRSEAIYSIRAAEIYERLGNLERLAFTLNSLGGYAYLGGRWNEALELFERARQAFVKIGDDTNATVAEQNIADVSSDQGRFEEAEPLFRKVLEVRRAAGNPLEIAEAASFLGRHVARMGSFEEAQALLEEARGLYVAQDDEFEVLTTDERLAEYLVLAGAADAALPLVEETLRRAEGMQGVSLLAAKLNRLRGWGYMQTNRLDQARETLEQSLRLAQLEDENFGFWSTDYEIALTLSALVRLGTLTGEPTDELAARRDAVLARLGVVSVPEPPLPQ